jgi:hypothetical protein
MFPFAIDDPNLKSSRKERRSMSQKCEADTSYIFPGLNMKNYMEGQTKNLEKDSNAACTTLEDESRK